MSTAEPSHAAHESDRDFRDQPRFGSYIGLFFVVMILGILTFALTFDVRPGHVFDRLRPGMTPTEVAAILGVPKAESRREGRVVQSWSEPGGGTFEVAFESGKLAATQHVPPAKSGP